LFAAGSTALADVAKPASANGDAETRPSMRAALREGFAFIQEQRGLTALVIVATVANFFGAPFIVVLPFFVEDTLGLASDWFGYLVACAGAGGLIGYVLAGSVQRARGALVLLSCLGAMATSILMLARVATPIGAAALFLVAGIAGGVFNVGVMTLMQKRTPDEMRGRVFGLVQTLAMAATPLAMLGAGALADATGRDARIIFAACGASLILVTLCGAAHRPLRDYLNDLPRESIN
jgi:MFS family permease